MTSQSRCSWCLGDSLYQHYHDNEWGVPCRDDKKLFEFLILEGAQAGLSWITILRKEKIIVPPLLILTPRKLRCLQSLIFSS